MEVFSHISQQRAAEIMNKKQLTMDDVWALQSFVFRPLYKEYNGLSRSELNEIYVLESKNIYRIMNAGAIMCGIYGDALQDLLRTTAAQRLIASAYDEYSTDEKFAKQISFAVLFKFLLSDFDIQCNPVFYGKVPQKLFGFRQTTAESWFKELVSFFSIYAAKIYIELGEETAFGYILGAIAYYLNNSQTFKYYASSSDKNMNDAIATILRKFISEMSGDSSMIPKGIVFYKDI